MPGTVETIVLSVLMDVSLLSVELKKKCDGSFL